MDGLGHVLVAIHRLTKTASVCRPWSATSIATAKNDAVLALACCNHLRQLAKTVRTQYGYKRVDNRGDCAAVLQLVLQPLDCSTWTPRDESSVAESAPAELQTEEAYIPLRFQKQACLARRHAVGQLQYPRVAINQVENRLAARLALCTFMELSRRARDRLATVIRRHEVVPPTKIQTPTLRQSWTTSDLSSLAAMTSLVQTSMPLAALC